MIILCERSVATTSTLAGGGGGSPSQKKTEGDLDNDRMASVLSLAHFPKSSPKSFPLFSNSSSTNGANCWFSCCRMLRLLSTNRVTKAFPVKHRAVYKAVTALSFTTAFPDCKFLRKENKWYHCISVILLENCHVV